MLQILDRLRISLLPHTLYSDWKLCHCLLCDNIGHEDCFLSFIFFCFIYLFIFLLVAGGTQNFMAHLKVPPWTWCMMH
jgi:hypothetical protein